MTVTNVQLDQETKTMTIAAEFGAGPERVWQLWDDPRQLERWWGPPTYPATFVDHDLRPGASVSYYMTGPQGDRSRGWWRVLSLDAPHSLEFESGFADESGNPDPEMPTMTIRVAISGLPAGGTRMIVETTFPSSEAMTHIVSMGMQEGMTSAIAQIDAML
jgi:uncharacterized protein YndB with AHSA1/START domain